MGLTIFGANDSIELVTSQAGAIHYYVKWIDATMADPPVVKGSTSGNVAAVISTAGDTPIVTAPGAGIMRDCEPILVRNASPTVTNDVTIQIDKSGTEIELDKVTLLPGEAAEYVDGVGFFKRAIDPAPVVGTNKLTGADQALGAADTYMNNSALPLAGLGAPVIGRCYHWRFMVVKTAAGTATPIIQVRVGTAGTTGDTSRLTFTWGAGTAAIDRGEVELEAMFIQVGASAVLRGKANWTTNLATTGLTNAVKALQPADSGTFDSNVANSIIGLSYNAGASGAHTLEYMGAWTDNF